MTKNYLFQITLVVIVLSFSSINLVNSLFLAEEQVLPYKCTDADRTKDCSGSTERTVCGWFNETIKCFRYPCAITSKSICEACNNENVSAVTDKDCENQDDKPVSNTNDNNNPDDNGNTDDDTIDECTEEQRNQDLMCTEDWLPVCGYKEKIACGDESKACVQNYGNNCTACKDKEVMYTRKGECPVYKSDTITDTNENNEEVKYTITGKEDDTKYAELHFCSSDEQEVKTCDGVKNEDVCGFTNCDKKDGCPQDFANACLACKSSIITYYTTGNCQSVAPETIRLQYLALTADVVLKSSSISIISVIGLTTVLLLLSL